MTPKISVIIPVYNTEKYLKKCLDSVINQTFKDIEIICINDGSTDNSLKILKEYEAKDNRIKVINQENQGLSGSRNTGIDNISGELCYFLDSDDYIEQNLLEYTVKIFENFDIDYFCFSSEPFREDENIIQNVDNIANYVKVHRDGLYKLNFDINLNTNIHVWNKVFKSSIIKENSLYFIRGLLYEDIYFMWVYSFLSKNAYFDDTVYHHYRIRSESLMEQTTKVKSYENSVSHMYNWHELMLKISEKEELFRDNYDNLLKLLNNYTFRTKELCTSLEKYKVEKLKLQYENEIQNINKHFIEFEQERRLKEQQKLLLQIEKSKKYKFTEKIFSVKNIDKHKVICVLGLKMKIKLEEQ